MTYVQDVIREENGKFHVYSESGKHLGGPYASKAEAEKRLRQVEFFKHQGDAVTIDLSDTFTLDNVSRSRNGYLNAFARAARTGIQIYKGKELGRPDLESVRVLRPATEVFAPDAMRSFTNLPVTHTHPREPVRSTNWKKFAVGYTGEDVVRDGEFIRVPLRIADQAAIDAYEKDGVKELSMGYSTDLQWTPGLTEDGQEYDAVQTALRGNHLALVPRARGGQDLRIGDDIDTGGKPMATKTIIVDGVSLEMPDIAASVVERSVKSLSDSATDLRKQLDAANETVKKVQTDSATAITTAQKAVETKDAEIATLKKQLADSAVTPEKLDVMVKDRQSVIDRAKLVLPSTFVFDGKKVEDIRKEVVSIKMGDAAKGWNDDQMKASFDTLTAGQREPGASQQLGDAMRNNIPHNAADARDKAYSEYLTNLNDAWKTPKPLPNQQH